MPQMSQVAPPIPGWCERRHTQNPKNETEVQTEKEGAHPKPEHATQELSLC